MIDRDAIARARRRRELEEALADERDREAVLRDQIEAVVLDEEGPRLDAALRAALGPDDAELLADVLGADDDVAEDAEELDTWGFDDDADDNGDGDAAGSELERLHGEIELSRARQRALERAVTALESPLSLPDGLEAGG